MRQTETYNLKLIETSDPFGPEALNANAETLEAQLARVDAAAAAETVRMDGEISRVDAAVAAEQSAREAAVAAEEAARKSAVSAEETARKSAITAEQSARTALAATVPKFTCGEYVGTGVAGAKINLPFTPKLLFVGNEMGYPLYYERTTDTHYRYGGIALADKPLLLGSKYPLITITTNGFYVYNVTDYDHANVKGVTYRYFAIG